MIPTPDNLQLYKSKDGWRWRRRSANGEILASSSEAYENRVEAVDNMLRVNAPPYEVVPTDDATEA